MNKKYIVIGVVVLVIASFIVGMMVSDNSSQSLGAANRLPHGYWDTADGYYVDGTAVINGSGQLADGLTIAGAGATSTLVFGTYKGCIQMITTSGSTTALTLSGTSSPAWVLTAGSCE